MNSQLVFAICLVLAVGFGVLNAGKHNENPEVYSDGTYDEDQYDEASEKDLTSSNDEKVKKVFKDMDVKATGLVQHNESDLDAVKNKGLCHWGIAVWYKPGFQIRCNCMKCTCKLGGKWDCGYDFAYCPYYYCGNQIYNPSTKVCCCGKVYTKKSSWSCCGYFYYYSGSSKCCNYYTVKSKAISCPRDKVIIDKV